MKVLTSTLLSIALCTGLQAQTFELSSQEEASLLSFQGSVFHTTSDEVRNLRQVDVGGSSVVLLLWEEFEARREITTSHYAISLDGRSVAVRPGEQVEQRLPAAAVEADERLVDDQHLERTHEGERELRLLAQPAAERHRDRSRHPRFGTRGAQS